MDQLTELLRENNIRDFEILSEDIEVSQFPKLWQKIIQEKEASTRIELVKEYWTDFKTKLPKVYQLITEQLTDVFVIKDKTGYKLVYIFVIDDFSSVYVGLLPTKNGPFLDNLPNDIAEFYTTLHNGWYENISGGLGFLPLENITFLSDMEWGILDEIETPPFKLSDLFYIFHNAGSGYLCIDISNKAAIKYLVWWADKKPKLNLEFWSFIDSWIEIGLTD